MNNFRKHARSEMALGLLILAAITNGAAQAQVVKQSSGVQKVAGHRGYMIEVHTCNIDDAGTDSRISMSMPAMAAGKSMVLGPWVQDWTYYTYVSSTFNVSYNDHERNQWDTYYFPESTTVDSINQIVVNSDGSGSKSGWCTDTIYITKIETDVPVRTWVWTGPSPWIYKGNTILTGLRENTLWVAPGVVIPFPRRVPTGLFAQFDLQTAIAANPNLTTGTVLAQYVSYFPPYKSGFPPPPQDPAVCQVTKTFSLVSSGGIANKTVRGTMTSGACVWETSFSSVPYGHAVVATPDSCASIYYVPKGGYVFATMMPGTSGCQ